MTAQPPCHKRRGLISFGRLPSLATYLKLHPQRTLPLRFQGLATERVARRLNKCKTATGVSGVRPQAARLHRELHANQKRKGSDEPYIGHLLSVASLVLQYGGREDEAIAALLHDAVEDQGGRPRDALAELLASLLKPGPRRCRAASHADGRP